MRGSAVALHWLLGLVLLARGDEDAALAEFERELAAEPSGHLYARECCANTWYAIGALRLRQRREDGGAAARSRRRSSACRTTASSLMVLTSQSLSRLAAQGLSPSGARKRAHSTSSSVAAIARRTRCGEAASRRPDRRCGAAPAPPGNAGWLLPVEPLLNVSSNPDVWLSVLSAAASQSRLKQNQLANAQPPKNDQTVVSGSSRIWRLGVGNWELVFVTASA